MKIDANEYGTGTNCSANNKPNVTLTVKYCNSITCDSDWDTEDGFVVSNSIVNQVQLLVPLLGVPIFVSHYLSSLHSLTPSSRYLWRRRCRMVYGMLRRYLRSGGSQS